MKYNKGTVLKASVDLIKEQFGKVKGLEQDNAIYRMKMMEKTSKTKTINCSTTLSISSN